MILDDQLDPAPVVHAAHARQVATLSPRRAALYALTAHAAATQAPARASLNAQGVAYQPFYLVNMIAVEGDLALARQLAQQPAVNRLAANPEVAGLRACHRKKSLVHGCRSGGRWRQPRRRRCPMASATPKRCRSGSLAIVAPGIVVGSQDTGVNWDHPHSRAYRGWNVISGTVDHIYNWVDAFGRNEQDLALQQDHRFLVTTAVTARTRSAQWSATPP